MISSAKISGAIEGWTRFVGEDEPGFAVGVWAATHEMISHCCGRAYRGGPPIDTRTLFDLASVSKMFTALGVLLVLDEKNLSLDTELSAILPEMAMAAPGVRLRHLLYHTSAMPDYMELFAENGWGTETRLGMQETLDILAAQVSAGRRPGSSFSYSNTGYVLLSAAIERLFGVSMAAFAAERIFEPFGMKRTRIVDRMPLRGENIAVSYVDGFGQEINPLWDMTGDGQVYTCLEDMSAWVSEIVSPRHFPSVIPRLLTRGALDDGSPLEYGGGVQFETFGERIGFGHDGGWAGFSSTLLFEPEMGVSLVVLTNRMDIEAGEIGRGLMRAMEEAP